MKPQRKQQMEGITEDEIRLALRRRIQLQSLCHRIGQSVAAHNVMRFRKAGTWDSEINQPNLPSLLSVLMQMDHPLRTKLPDGPLVVVVENDAHWTVNVSDHLLSHDLNIRRAALRHFLSAQSSKEIWVSPYVLDLLTKNMDKLQKTEESVWIDVGLMLRDAIEHDFRVNCAGVRQSCWLRSEACYEDYLNKVIRPRAHFFKHDRPSVVNPAEEQELILAKIKEWSLVDDLGMILNRYLEFCGYLPLTGELSAASLIEAWTQQHPGQDVWQAVWKWVDSSASVLAQYHAAHAFLEHPDWILLDESERLLNIIRGIISSFDGESSYSEASLWRLRAHLLQHYQVHLEASIPGLNSEVIATAACWLTEMVAQLFYAEPDHVNIGCDLLVEKVLPLSLKRWTMARSRMQPSPLRIANLYSPAIWHDALLATAVRRFADFPKCEAKEEYRTFLIARLTSALCVGSLRTMEQADANYSFELPVSLSHLELPKPSTDNQYAEAVRQAFAIRTEIETGSRLKELLTELPNLPEEIAVILCYNLRSWKIDSNYRDSDIGDLLNESEWRRTIFHGLPIRALDMLISFLMYWQLQQGEDWLIRMPQVFACECENAKEPERRNLLLSATVVSSMAADVTSPVTRLLTGPIRLEIVGLFNNWRQLTHEISRNSEPWLAARIRGFLGTIENFL